MLSSRARAVIWDMDGVIADTAPLHFQAWRETFQKRGVSFTEEDFKFSFGRRNDASIRKILGDGVPPDEIEIISKDKEENFRRRIGLDLKPLPGVIELMNLLAEHGFRMALVSSAPKENIRLLTEGLGIDKFFQCTVAAKDVIEGKPSPEGFLLASKKLGVKPERCIVIEDAVVGVVAAKRAGMRCLAVTNTHSRTSLAEADIIVDTLVTVTISDLERLLTSS